MHMNTYTRIYTYISFLKLIQKTLKCTPISNALGKFNKREDPFSSPVFTSDSLRVGADPRHML